MAVWLLVEVAVRRVGSSAVLAGFQRVAGRPEPTAMPTLVLVGSLAFAMGILLLFFRRRARRERLTSAALGYRWSRQAVRAGLIAGAALFAIVLATALVDRSLFDPEENAGWPQRLAAAGPVTMVALLLTNGLLVPAVEEYAWRGYIQRHLVRRWGAAGGIAVTAAGFAAKHLIVDLSLTRTVTLVVGALALGVIAARWGTAASTLAHAATNTAATLLAIVQAVLP